MFDWIFKIFRKKTFQSGISEYEVQQRKRILLQMDNPEISKEMKILAKDFITRIDKQDSGGVSSSPVSSS
jgi:hypothetical protein